MQAFAGQHHAGLHQLLVELAHLGQQLLAGHHAGFGFLRRLDHHHESHRLAPSVRIVRFAVSLCIRRDPPIGAPDALRLPTYTSNGRESDRQVAGRATKFQTVPDLQGSREPVPDSDGAADRYQQDIFVVGQERGRDCARLVEAPRFPSRPRRHGAIRAPIRIARYGVAMRDIQTLAKRFGRNHDLAAALWSTGWYEARLLAAYVDDPARLTPAQMDRWCRDFDNWGICDTVCFVLFDKTPHAWTMVKRWAGRRDEFVKRAAFALLWGLSVHDKTPPIARSSRSPPHRARCS